MNDGMREDARRGTQEAAVATQVDQQARAQAEAQPPIWRKSHLKKYQIMHLGYTLA